jgi:carboxylate-amine ligase
MQVPSLGVEEEYQLVDAQTGVLRPDCRQVMKNLQAFPDARSEIQHELHLNQIEMATPVCQTLAEVQANLARTRGALIASAELASDSLASAGTHPYLLPEETATTPSDRYQTMLLRFKQLARDLLIFGCHVHVSMPDKQQGVAVMNHVRRWLPMLQALSASSPFWNNEDTGYASYRRELWIQWPMAGPPAFFRDLSDYKDCIEQLVRCGAIKDESYIYWDIRLPVKVPTIEVRCADAMLRIDETVGYAGLVRALVMRGIRDVQSGAAPPTIGDAMLRHALWHAARFGTTGPMIDMATCHTREVSEIASEMLERLEDELEQSGDTHIVHNFIRSTIQNGNGAERQRRVFEETQSLQAVVSYVVRETASGAIVPD